MEERTLATHDENLSATTLGEREEALAQEDEIDLLDLLRVLLANKSLILKFAFGPAVLTAIVLVLMKPTYTAEASFLPPNSMTSGPSALLGQLGALSGAGSALGGFRDPTQIYVGMLKSRTVADDIIRQFDLAKVYKTKKLSQTERALRLHSDFTAGKDTIVVISVTDHDPKRAADLANAYLADLHKLSDRIAITDAGQKRLFFERQLEKEKNTLSDAEVDLTKVQQQTGMILPGGQTQLQLQTIARTHAEISSREVQLEALSQAATEQNPEVIRLRSEIAGLRAELGRLENSGKQGGSGNVEVPTSRVPGATLNYVRKAREVKYHEALYELLLRQYESARLDESRSAPLMQVVDYAVVPDTKSGPLRTLFTLLAFVLGAFLGLVWVVVRYRLGALSQDPDTRAKLAAVRDASRWRRHA
ncbi:GumC family protein [Edaphobacter bradus]|uniref:GumC family protein n=1 Tax=Edaphobacter bradus TaxID=2259016 RepID=UPI0021E0CF00|nr:Wzz/FepE/Etk N-terminal domain-containing protein [Edaphobacter bradus]